MQLVAAARASLKIGTEITRDPELRVQRTTEIL